MNHLSHRPLSLDCLRSFEAVARRLSFSAAAEEMHLTQPAISRQIKGLEEELGAPLFTRGTRKVELTAAGHPIGNHTYDHVYVLAKKPEEIQFRFKRSPWLIEGKTPAEVIGPEIA